MRKRIVGIGSVRRYVEQAPNDDNCQNEERTIVPR